jgi:hypothetical protein
MGSTARAIDRSPVLIKSGDDVYPFLENYGEFTPVEFELLGKKHWAYPFSRFGTEREGGFVFISNFHHYGSLYYQNKSIWRVETPILFRNQFLLQSALNGGLTVKWALPVYKAMIRFGMQVIPGGKWAGRGMSLMSLATFWAGHLHEIEAGIELTHYLVRDLRTLYKRCPLLTKAMLLVAMEETITDLRAQIKKEGLFTVIADNADGEKYMETVVLRGAAENGDRGQQASAHRLAFGERLQTACESGGRVPAGLQVHGPVLEGDGGGGGAGRQGRAPDSARASQRVHESQRAGLSQHIRLWRRVSRRMPQQSGDCNLARQAAAHRGSGSVSG